MKKKERERKILLPFFFPFELELVYLFALISRVEESLYEERSFLFSHWPQSRIYLNIRFLTDRFELCVHVIRNY